MTDLDVYKKMNQREHLLLRPDTFVGSLELEEKEIACLDISQPDLLCFFKKVPYSPALERLFLEILSNAGDNVRRSRKEGIDPGKIDVTIKDGWISIYNEGKTVPTDIHPEYGIPVPQLIFGELLTGSNFDDEEERRLGGRNGIGAKAANILSRKFIVEIGDPKGVSYRQVFENNMATCHSPVIGTFSGVGFTRISYLADFKRFGTEGYSTDMVNAFCKHAVDLSLTAKVPVVINKRKVELKSLEEYGRLYVKDPLVKVWSHHDEENDVIFFDCPFGGRAISFVNGIITEKGGVHTQAWLELVTKPFQGEFKKHEVTVKDVKPHVTLILSCNLDKPKFKTQTKDCLVGPKPKIVGEGDMSFLLQWDLKGRIYQALMARDGKILSKTDGKKSNYISVSKARDAKFAGTLRSGMCTLCLSEGDSAAGSVIKGIGDQRDYYGCYPLKGKVMNTSKSDDKKISSNKEIGDIKKLLGLKEGMDYTNEKNFDTLRYGSILIMADQDPDGVHIRGLLHNLFRDKYKSLLIRGFVKVMETPLIKAKKGKTVTRKFYSKNDYDVWNESEEAKTGKWEIKYFKGLGTLEDPDIVEEFKNPRLHIYEFDDKAALFMSIAFDPDKAEYRRKLIDAYLEGNPNQITKEGTISHFVMTELILFFVDDLYRSIPRIQDGLKIPQRKILYATMEVKKPIKVSQLAGKVAEMTKYHHGEKSLTDAIVNMGQSHVGTNNVPLLEKHGQWGSRGNEASAPRYIDACIASIVKYIFRSEDDILLEHVLEDGEKVEPMTYYPIIPMFALNGSVGIGVGYSTDIPCYHPLMVIKWLQVRILKWLGDTTLEYPEMKPWYKGYKGTIKMVGGRWHSQGSYQNKNGKILVTELPVSTTISRYQEKLEKKKGKEMLKEFKDLSYAYEVKGEENQLDLQPQFQILGFVTPDVRRLGLDSIIGDQNLTLFDKNYRAKKYATIEEAMEEYAQIRREKYGERIKHRLTARKKELETEKKRLEFVKEVIQGTLVLHKDDEVLKEEMEKRGYPESLLQTRVQSFTKSKLDELKKTISAIEKDIQYYTEISPEKLWLNELTELASKLKF